MATILPTISVTRADSIPIIRPRPRLIYIMPPMPPIIPMLGSMPIMPPIIGSI